MNIYIDFDDVLCETAKAFVDIAKRMFNKDIPYENIHFFNLQKSFELNEDEYEEMMIEAHRRESLLSYVETDNASEVINSWVDEGHDIKIITGRPFSAYEASREWLDQHNLSRVELICVNKYGRDSFIKNSSFSISLDELYSMHFDLAVEDSPMAFEHLMHFPDCKVAVFDRPWNHNAELPNDNFIRCFAWNKENAGRSVNSVFEKVNK